MRGLERRKLEKGSPRSPTGEECRTIEEKVIATSFSSHAERLTALAVVRAIFRYNSSSAKITLEKLSPEGKSQLDQVLAEVGFELKFSEENPGSSPKLTRRKPDLKIVG